MSRGALLLFAWLYGGHAVAAAFYVALINVPDANVAMLVLSLALLTGGLVVIALTEATAVGWLVPRQGFRQALGRAVRRGVPALLLALAIHAAGWLTTGWLDTWHANHAGEIDAWFISVADTANVSWLHQAITLVIFVLRYIVGPSLALAAFCATVVNGLSAATRLRWIPAAFARTQLGTVGLVVVVFVALPWRAVDWRPARLPANAAELLFVGIKLALISLIMHAGWVLTLFAGARTALPGGRRSTT